MLLKGPALEMAKAATGLDDEAIAGFHPGMEKLFENIGRVTQVHAIAEVVKSENCFNDVKVGDIIESFELVKVARTLNA